MVTVPQKPANSNNPDADATSGHGPMSSVLKRAEAAVADLAKDYPTWARADVAKARVALTVAGDDPDQRAEQIGALFRVAHDLKGQGASFGFPLVTKIGQSLCILTRDRMREYGPREFDLAKSHLDAIDLVLAKSIRGDGGKVGTDLVAKLEQRVKELIG